MKRFELSEGTSNKFWEIEREGASVTTHWGRIGADGQTKTNTFASAAAAVKEYEKLVGEKTKKGYRPATGATVAVVDKSSASGRPGARYFELIEGTSSKFWEVYIDGADGEEVVTRYGRIGTEGSSTTKELESGAAAWKEMSKLIAEKTKKGYVEKTAGAPKTNPALDEAIFADPENPQAYVVYADWLQEQGDPRGELIMLQQALAKRPGDPQITAALKAFFAEHEPMLLGPLQPWQTTQDGRDEPAFTWKNGFIHGARLSVVTDGDTEFDGDLGDYYEMVVNQPSGKFLVELRVGVNLTSYDDDQQPLIKAMLKHPPRALRVLHIGDFDTEESEISWFNIGDLSKLWKVIPHLRHLILRGGSWTLGDLDLPEVRRVELLTGGLSKASGNAIAKARIPKVEHLEIWYGTDSYGGSCTPATVAALLDRKDLPALRSLGLKNADFGDAICELVTKGALTKQLSRLDLSMSVLGDDGARALAAGKETLAHLDELDVSETYITSEGLELLQGCAKKIIANELREADDEDDRYVVCGE